MYCAMCNGYECAKNREHMFDVRRHIVQHTISDPDCVICTDPERYKIVHGFTMRSIFPCLE